MHAQRFFLPLVLLAGPVLAQAPAPLAAASAEAAPEGRTPQRIERIQIEDAGSRVDEVRVGGQTQSINVQPKVGNLPAYEVQPADGVRNRARSGAETNTGTRLWNLKNF